MSEAEGSSEAAVATGGRALATAAGLGELVVGFALLLCLAPVVLQYAPPQRAGWDEADFLGRTICVNRAAAALDVKGFAACLAPVKRPALMALSALPFGALATSPGGLVLIPVAYTILQWLMLVAIAWLLIAIAVPRWLALVTAASVGTAGAITLHAGRLLGDVPFALTVAMAILLVPLEARPGEPPGARSDVARGALWGLVLAMGLLGKMTFLPFAGILGATLVLLRWRARGVRSVRATLAAMLVAGSPGFLVVALTWKKVWRHARASSFGEYSSIFSRGLRPLSYLADLAASAPFLAAVCVALAVALPIALARRRPAARASLPGILAVLLYEAAVLASPNQDPRLQLPMLVALPIALAVPWSRLEPARPAAGVRNALAWIAAGLLLAIPMAARYDFSNVVEQGRILARLAPPAGVARVVLTTDDPALNRDTLEAARELVPGGPSRLRIDIATHDEIGGRGLAFSLRTWVEPADYLILQPDRAKLWPEWSNRHADAFLAYARANGRLVAELSGPDLEVYALTAAPR